MNGCIEKKKARTFRKFSYRGIDLDQFCPQTFKTLDVG